MVRRRPGFTLIELLIVVAIVVVLIGLTFPAVHQVRAAAFRSQCENNLKQIGLAFHQYDAVVGHLPPAGFSDPAPIGPAWSAFLLPYLEQQPLFDRMRFDLPACDPTNVPLLETPIKVFQCPSAPQDRSADFATAVIHGTIPGIQLAITDYSPVWGPSPVLASYLPPGTPVGRTGAMVPDQCSRFSDIADGTSNTLLVVEMAGRPQRWQNGILLPYPPFEAFGAGWGDWLNSAGFLGQDKGGAICVVNCDNQASVYSFHTSGANVLAADGSVHFLSSATDLATLAALVSSRGGENVTLP